MPDKELGIVLKIFKDVRCRLHIKTSETSNNDHFLGPLLGGRCRGYFYENFHTYGLDVSGL